VSDVLMMVLVINQQPVNHSDPDPRVTNHLEKIAVTIVEMIEDLSPRINPNSHRRRSTIPKRWTIGAQLRRNVLIRNK
jgi:hypothetical protein